MCEGHCCSRKGLPLMPGYAITIAKSQGMSIGANKPATHARVKLQRKTDMERNCLGTAAYTAFSRCEKESNWCLVESIPQQRLFYINEHPRMKPRRDEEQRLQNLSRNTIDFFIYFVQMLCMIVFVLQLRIIVAVFSALKISKKR